MEHVSPILIALAALLGGGGVIGLFSWISASYREKRIGEWRQAAAQSELDTSRIKLQSIKDEQDQLDWMLGKIEELKISQSNLKAENTILLNRIERNTAKVTMENFRFLGQLTSLFDNCTCTNKEELEGMITQLKERQDALEKK